MKLCQCGCGKQIIPKSWHKYYRHDFLLGHKPKRKLEKLNCNSCGIVIFKSPYVKQKYIKHYCSTKCARLGLFKRAIVK